MTVKRNRRDRTGRIWANTGQFKQSFLGIGEDAVILGRDHFGAFMQIARPGVISQPLPTMQNIIKFCIGKVGDGWPALQKGVKIRTDRLHSGLLQHDLAKPDVIWIGQIARFGPPRQGAMMAIIPFKHAAI